MSIYTSTSVEQFFIDNGLNNVYHNKREHCLKLTYPSLYNTIIAETSFLGNCSLYERLYCYLNHITERPGCLTCGKQISFRKHVPREYHRYCNSTCAMNDMKTLLGVDNASQLDSVKQKKKETCLKNHGVEHYAQCKEGRTLRSQNKINYWNKVYQNKDFTADGLTRAQYKNRAMQYADTQYRRYQHIIDPDCLRSRTYHLEHIFSLTDGFLNDVPINIISDISNLRMLPSTENYRKNSSSHKTLQELYEDYNHLSKV